MKLLPFLSLVAFAYELSGSPIFDEFGFIIDNLDVRTLHGNEIALLKKKIHEHRVLIIKQGDLSWEDQIEFTEKLGESFVETSSSNRKKHDKTPDPRIAIISNDTKVGLKNIGTEGFHVDGTIIEKPHKFSILYCKRANKGGNTLFAPIRETLESLPEDEFNRLLSIDFVSSEGPVHPLIYRHYMDEWSAIIGLGKLSAPHYKQNGTDISIEDTKEIKNLIEKYIWNSSLLYSHNYENGDLVIWDNTRIVHKASQGTQESRKKSGLRLMHRTTVKGTHKPKREEYVGKTEV
jgi:alpha-ketoglutarate-dependent taurine dioxygenase